MRSAAGWRSRRPVRGSARCRRAARSKQVVPDRRGQHEADRAADHDREDHAEEARPQLAEVVDERHDGAVGRRRGRWRAGFGRRRDAGPRCVAQGVGVGHRGRGTARLVGAGRRLAGARSSGRRGGRQPPVRRAGPPPAGPRRVRAPVPSARLASRAAGATCRPSRSPRGRRTPCGTRGCSCRGPIRRREACPGRGSAAR